MRCSIWRPLFGPIKDNAVALCDSRSIEDYDLIESDHIYPDFESETYMAFHADRHVWYYLADQTRDEVLLITNYDSLTETRTLSLFHIASQANNYSRKFTGVLHSGFDIQSPGEYTRGRQSIELKMVVAG